MAESGDDINTKNFSIKNFFIFNSLYGSTEGEEQKKTLFYSPSETDPDTKIKDTGLCEAIIKFSNTFTLDESVHCMRTQKTLQLYYQAENDFWMIMTINVPSERKTRDGGEYNEYKGDDAHETVFHQVIKQSYYMFCLFNGTFRCNLVGENSEKRISNLTSKLNKFYSKYLLTMKLHNCDIVDIYRSIQYLPLNKFQFLRVHNFIQMIESTFNSIKYSIFLFNDELVWSEINPSDLYSIYEYLTGLLLPKSAEADLLGSGSSLTRSYSNGLDSHCGAYLTGPTDQPYNFKRPPSVHIYNNGRCQIFKMIVCSALSATLCLFVDENTTLTKEFYDELHTFIGPQLTSIASDIGEQLVKESTTVKSPLYINTSMTSLMNISSGSDDLAQSTKFLFFNELNCQHNGTVHFNQKLFKKKKHLPRDIMNLLNDLYVQNANALKSSEVIVKTLSDYWIVKRSSNWRHSFIIFNKNATLLEIANEANKLFELLLNDVLSRA